MNKGSMKVNMVKLMKFILKFCWIPILCAVIGFGLMYYRATKNARTTYTATGTMYITNPNPQLYNYGYYSATDAAGVVQLINNYSVLIQSKHVMEKVMEFQVEPFPQAADESGEVSEEVLEPVGTIMLCEKWPDVTASSLANSIRMASINETNNVRVSCTTYNPLRSVDYCNAVMMVAPEVLKELAVAGEASIVDSAEGAAANRPSGFNRGLVGGMGGAAAAILLLALIFLLRRRVTDASELTDNYTLPILSQIRRDKRENKDPGGFLLSRQSDMQQVESYAKLRINLLYTLVEKQNNVVEITSAISGEGKSTVAANLAISCAMSGKRVLLVDADMRRACQHDVFHYDGSLPGLSNVLVSTAKWKSTIIPSGHTFLDILPAGHLPPNPAGLLESNAMRKLLRELSDAYDLVLLDVPPINIVSDPLTLAKDVAGSIFVVRQNFSDHREIRKALSGAEMTGMDMLGFVFYGENLQKTGYYSKKYYKSYYNKYDNRDGTGKQVPELTARPNDTDRPTDTKANA